MWNACLFDGLFDKLIEELFDLVIVDNLNDL